MLAHAVKRLFTVEEYHQMVDSGLFREDDRLELLEGEILEMSPIGSRHGAAVKRGNRLFSAALVGRAVIAVQDPVQLSDLSEPQPDLTLLRLRSDFYEAAHPRPEDIYLVVEIADTSVVFDREVKLPLYAASGIPEVWLLDLATGVLEVLRDPRSAGYRSILRLTAGETVAPLAFPDLVVDVAALTGSARASS